VVLAGVTTSIMGKGEYAASILLIRPHSTMFLVGLFLYYQKSLAPSARMLAVLSVALSLTFSDHYENIGLFATAIAAATIFITFRKMIDIKFLSLAGMISYSWYLIHQNIGVIIIREVNALGLTWASIPTAVVLTFLLALAMNRLIEFRFRRQVASAFKLLFHPLALLAIKRSGGPTARTESGALPDAGRQTA
jgi:peptidoglycan/LPS O-acetylase OafA/YrhL